MFEIRFSKGAIKELKKLPRPISKRIFEQISLLQKNPYVRNIKKLAGQPFFRLRIGDYRVIFEIKKKDLILFIIKVAHRKNIYKR